MALVMGVTARDPLAAVAAPQRSPTATAKVRHLRHAWVTSVETVTSDRAVHPVERFVAFKDTEKGNY